MGDDALGLYLKQMGAISLLNRNEEIDVTERLDVLKPIVAKFLNA